MPSLTVREARVQLAGLGVDEVGRERAGVAAEERVRERAVAPEEAAEVEADEQLAPASRSRTRRFGMPPRAKSVRKGSE